MHVKKTSETVGAKRWITQIIAQRLSELGLLSSRQLGWQQQMPDAHTS